MKMHPDFERAMAERHRRIPTDAERIHDLEETVDRLSAERDRLLSQRDALLAACESAIFAMTNQRYLTPRIGMEKEHAACVAAIASVKGDQTDG